MAKHRFTVTSHPPSPTTSFVQCDKFWMLQLCFSHILMYLLVVCMYEQMAGVWYCTTCLFLILPTIFNLNNSYIKVALQGVRVTECKIQRPVTYWRWTVSFMSPRQTDPKTLSKKMGGPQSSREYLGEKKNLLPVRNQTMILQSPSTDPSHCTICACNFISALKR
jgi:hypothetical protein